MSLVQLAGEMREVTELRKRVPLENTGWREVTHRDIRHDAIPYRCAAVNNRLPAALVEMFEHGQEVVPGSTTEIVRQDG